MWFIVFSGCHIQVKPLGVIWGKYGEFYNRRNTIMFDDIGRNFLMNPQNGLKVNRIIVVIFFSSLIISVMMQDCFLCVIRSDHSWRPTWTERKTGSCINCLNTSKKSPSSMTSVVSTTNTGRGKHRVPSAHINNANSWIEPCCVCLANTWTWWRLCHYITVAVQDCLRKGCKSSRPKAALASPVMCDALTCFPMRIFEVCFSR